MSDINSINWNNPRDLSEFRNQFEIRRTLMASTAHTLEEDFNLLGEAGLTAESIDYGTRIYIGHHEEQIPIVDHISNFNFSEGFRLLVLFAVSFNCNWLELDVDGPIYERIPEYEW